MLKCPLAMNTNTEIPRFHWGLSTHQWCGLDLLSMVSGSSMEQPGEGTHQPHPWYNVAPFSDLRTLDTGLPFHPDTGVEWCCFYYFVRNSLVTLLQALRLLVRFGTPATARIFNLLSIIFFGRNVPDTWCSVKMITEALCRISKPRMYFHFSFENLSMLIVTHLKSTWQDDATEGWEGDCAPEDISLCFWFEWESGVLAELPSAFAGVD